MNKRDALALLQQIRDGSLSPEEGLLRLRKEPFEDLGYAKLDSHRELRQGVPEVIYGAGKTPQQIADITGTLLQKGQKTVIITRLSPEAAKEVMRNTALAYYPMARIGIAGEMPEPDGFGTIAIATGGTSDMPVAEEAAVTAEALGNKVVRVYDVGVAGLHRLLARLDLLMEARVIIAIAGMEGALAGVIGGLVDCPVIGVPTSVGYGAAFGGVAALLSMLNACASGVCVVNIDNGFGAGYLASMMNHMGGKV